MTITTYTELQSAMTDWLMRADLDTRIPDCIALAEATLNKVLRDSRMITSTTLSLSANTRNVAVPTDMLEPVLLQMTSDEDYPLEQIDVAQLIALRRSRTRTAGTPRFYAMVGRYFQVTPTPTLLTGLTLDYYQAIPALASNTTNWLLTYQPDVYLYTALMHAYPLLKDEKRAEVFGSLVAQQVTAAIQANSTAQLDAMRTPGFSLNTPSDPGRA